MPRPPRQDDAAQGHMLLELAIGEDEGSDSRYQFASIASVLEGEDGILWVADGADSGLTPLLRQFTAEGEFIRQVGRAGSGPGEYRSPQGLALLKGGRVALRDFRAPGRITVYDPDGTLDAVWTLGTRYWWSPSRGHPIEVDTAGIIWLPVMGDVRPTSDRHPPFFIRVSPEGEVLDTVRLPPLPDVERQQLRFTLMSSSGPEGVIGIAIPYQPSSRWTWSPIGAFAIARTDLYRVDLVAPTYETGDQGAQGPQSPEPLQVFTREVEPVVVGREERAAAARRIREELDQWEDGKGLKVPELPDTKPILTSMRFTTDGRLLVFASIPSVLRDGVWTQPMACDFFAATGRFEGRLPLPEGLMIGRQLLRIDGNRVWAVHIHKTGVQSVRRYRLVWPDPEGL